MIQFSWGLQRQTIAILPTQMIANTDDISLLTASRYRLWSVMDKSKKTSVLTEPVAS